MSDAMLFFLIGIVTCVGSFLLKKRENRLFENAVDTTAVVIAYDDYPSANGNWLMYTAVMEYTLLDGTTIQAREQCSRNRKKYPIGMELPIQYSTEQPGLFVPKGDRSRPVAFFIMFLFGFVLVALSVYMYLKGAGAI